MQAYLFEHAGYAVLPAMLDQDALAGVDAALATAGAGAQGARQMLQYDWCVQLAEKMRAQLIMADIIAGDYIAVQCTLFEKSRDHNWLVAPHQDLSIPVTRRIDHPALTGWSAKDGVMFVQPPVAVLAQLVALRLHIDDCHTDDGALKIVPGSHHFGRLDDAGKAQLKMASGDVVCTIKAGSGMAMRPLLLHASSKATGNSRRRVLHFVFAPPALPHGLEWAAHRTPQRRGQRRGHVSHFDTAPAVDCLSAVSRQLASKYPKAGVTSDISTRPQP